MSALLVTGGTGRLGRPTVERLRGAGYDVQVLSRHAGDGQVVGDLRSGVGIRDAVAGVDTVLHLATRNGRGDVAPTRTLLEACRSAGVRHLIYTSIVGVDRIPLGYYREKLAIEGLMGGVGIPHTMEPAQIHELVAGVFNAQRHLPVILAPRFSLQPIATEDVATRLVELARAAAAGRVRDIGGPERLPAVELAVQWERAASVRRRIAPISLPAAPSPATRPGTTSCPARPTARSRSPTTRPDDMEHPHDARAETRPRRARIHRTRTRALDVIRTRELLQRRADRRSRARRTASTCSATSAERPSGWPSCWCAAAIWPETKWG